MKIYSTSSMVNMETNCRKEEAYFLILGAKKLNLEEFPGVRHIFRAGIGCDNFSADDLFDDGITLHFPSARTRDKITESVARLAVGWMLVERTLGKSLVDWNRDVERLRNRVLVVGGGRIGRRVAEIYNSIDCIRHVVISDPKTVMVSPKGFDIISLHIPTYAYEPAMVFQDNCHFVDKEYLGQCNGDVTIINTSRGFVVNEKQMTEFLLANTEAKYIADVFDEEPYNESRCSLEPLRGIQFFGTPHIGSYTIEAKAALTEDAKSIMEKIA